MVRRSWIFAAWLLLVFFWAAAALAEGEMPEGYSCTVCHSDKKAEFVSGIHYERGILCTACHGGDSSAMDETAHSGAAGFNSVLDDGKPPFTKKQIVKLCASCHSDARRMLQFGIPADQEALFRISKHGIALYKRNDSNVAVCTDCHGTHQILPPSDPRSKVYKKNIPETCASCHANKALMEKYGIPWDIYEKYKGSVHGKALLEKDDLSSPNCSVCHGVHGAAPPSVSEIENVCGQCHKKTRDFFNEGPHSAAMEQNGMRECVDCHGNHSIEKASLNLFDTVCANCHDKDSGAFRRGQKIKTLILDAAGTISDAEEEAREALRHGVDVEKYNQDLNEAETNLIRSAPVSHSLSVERIEQLTTKSMALSKDVKLDLFHHREELQERKLILVVIWAFILLMVPVTLVKRYLIKQKLQDGK